MAWPVRLLEDTKVSRPDLSGAQSGASAASADTVNIIDLVTRAFKIKGVHHVELRWNVTDTPEVDVLRNGVPMAITANDGAYVDKVGAKGEATYLYRVCERRPTNRSCSPRIPAIFM